VKVAPGLRLSEDEVRRLSEAQVECEFVSERGVCKEAALWCGGLARADGARRATVIDGDGVHSIDGDPARPCGVKPLGRFIGEPDPAVIRSGLLGEVAGQLEAGVVDPHVAYVTAEKAPATPFVRWFEVLASTPFSVRRLRTALRQAGIGKLVIKTRAFPLQPPAINALLKPEGHAEATLICATLNGRKTAIVCRPA
jgi:hypothetical protein